MIDGLQQEETFCESAVTEMPMGSIERQIFRDDNNNDIRNYYRLESEAGNIKVRSDIHKANGVKFLHVRIPSERKITRVSIATANTIESSTVNRLGWIFKVRNSGKSYLLWFPSIPVVTRLDQHARIEPTRKANFQWTLEQHIEVVLQSTVAEEETIFTVFVSDKDVDTLYAELAGLGGAELRCYVKSEWFRAENPGDIWSYLMNGSVYDPRSDKKIGMRFKCQQCAYAWWTYFDYMHQQTDKRVWVMMRDEIALCALNDMETSGAWRNGFWSNDMEIHSRFHLDGLHMLISQYERTGDNEWLDAAQRGMSYVEKDLVDTLDGGNVWFLHDDVHDSKRHKIRSTAFGKSEANSLCLNTHIQALTVLHRLSIHCNLPHNRSEELLQKGLGALNQVLACQPADALYRYFVPRLLALSNGKNQSTREMLKRRYKKRLLSTIYWKIRARYPRFVQPNGFIERDLTIEIASYRYHVTNVKDLLVLYKQRPLPWLKPCIEDGFRFLMDYLDEVGVDQALEHSPYFIEVAEIVYLYNEVIEPVSDKIVTGTMAGILKATGGYSLDYYASDLVHVQHCA